MSAEESSCEQFIRSDQLTIILTTSPTPSAPSTELVSSVLDSLPRSLYKLHLIISFDGFTISRNSHGRLKKGQIPQSMADAYPQYIDNVRSLFNTVISPERFDDGMHTYISKAQCPTQIHGGRITFIRHKYRQGFAFSVKAALDYCESANVLVMQHDWIFVPPIPPLYDLLNVMTAEEEVNYVTFIARQTVGYIQSTGKHHNRKTAVFEASLKLRSDRPYPQDLIACLHFLDRPHLCSVPLYRKIFESKILRRGDFIEDTMGCQYLSSIVSACSDENGVNEWLKFGCWLYYPRNGTEIAIRHLSGRTNLVKVEQEARVRNYIKENRLRKLGESQCDDGEEKKLND